MYAIVSGVLVLALQILGVLNNETLSNFQHSETKERKSWSALMMERLGDIILFRIRTIGETEHLRLNQLGPCFWGVNGDGKTQTLLIQVSEKATKREGSFRKL